MTGEAFIEKRCGDTNWGKPEFKGAELYRATPKPGTPIHKRMPFAYGGKRFARIDCTITSIDILHLRPITVESEPNGKTTTGPWNGLSPKRPSAYGLSTIVPVQEGFGPISGDWVCQIILATTAEQMSHRHRISLTA